MNQDGTQAIRRAAAILQRIAHVSDDAPATLRSISEAVDLPRSTAHRILKCLPATGLATYDSATRRYEVGMLCYELGLAVTDEALQLAPWAAAADRVAQRSNVTTYLMRRSGMEAVCVHKAEGRTVIRVIPVEVGQRRYLGVGAGATALLAGLPDAAVERILGSIAPELDAFENLTPDLVREAVAAARASGFAESRGRAKPRRAPAALPRAGGGPIGRSTGSAWRSVCAPRSPISPFPSPPMRPRSTRRGSANGRP